MKIFIKNLTQLDCAVLLPDGPCGKSWYVDVMWEGEQDAVGFVVDFNLAKKTAKNIIDSEFDHKLFLKPQHILFESNTKIIAAQSFFAINTFKNGIKKLSQKILADLEQNNVSSLETEIAHFILKNSPHNVKNISVKLTEQNKNTKKNTFNYTHSLCFHQGNCQRFHGHASCVEAYKDGIFDSIKSTSIADTLNNSFIISQNSLDTEWNSHLLQEILSYCCDISENKSEFYPIQYQGTQGEVALVLPKNKVTVLPYESTIENMAHYIRNNFFNEIQGHSQNIELRIYEGLSKGAIVI